MYYIVLYYSKKKENEQKDKYKMNKILYCKDIV